MNPLFKFGRRLMSNLLIGAGIIGTMLMLSCIYVVQYPKPDYRALPAEIFRGMDVDTDPRLLQANGRERNYATYPIDIKAVWPNPLRQDYHPTFQLGASTYAVWEINQLIPPIHPRHVNAEGYRCGYLCVNAEDQVVGRNPNYGKR